MIKESTELLLNIQGVAVLGLFSLIVIMSLVQWLSKRHNPWETFFNWVGMNLFKTQNGRLDTIEQRLDKIERHNEKQDQQRLEDQAMSARRKIILAADEICVLPTHTYEWYNQLMGSIDFYERYCKDHPNFPNEQAVTSIEIIKEAYTKHKLEDSFQHKPLQ